MDEDNSKRAMADAAHLAKEQEHAGQNERLQRALESRVRTVLPISHFGNNNNIININNSGG